MIFIGFDYVSLWKHDLFTRYVNYYKKYFTFFPHSITVNEKNIIFNDEKINKSSFYRIKKSFIIDDIDVNKILISKKQLYGKKKAHWNTFLLDIMIMTALDFYV